MKMSHAAASACASLAVIALAVGSASAQIAAPVKKSAAASTKKATTPAAPTAKPVVDSRALEAVRKMSAYLRTLQAFSVQVASERDEVDDFGQVLTFNGRVDYQVKMPNAFTIKVSEDRDARQFIYDGKTVTVFDPKNGYAAHFAAPATIRQTLDLAESKYGISVPLEDLFRWNAGDPEETKLTSAHYVGPAKLGDQEAEQYAFRQPDRDWQIWIAKGDKPVPLRIIIIGADDPARPQYEATLTWDTAGQFAADTFVFTPPADVKSIPITPAP
jgi:hypothetical protein